MNGKSKIGPDLTQAPAILALLALAAGFTFAGCSDGSSSLTGSAGSPGSGAGPATGSSGTTETGASGASAIAGTSNSGTAGAASGGTAPIGGAPGTGGALGSTGGSSGGSDSSAGSGGGTVTAADPYSGPFKILVLSKTLGFHHDSIPACQQMLRELGQCADSASCTAADANEPGVTDMPITGAKPNSTFTVDVAGAPTSGCPPIQLVYKTNGGTRQATAADHASYSSMGCDGSTSDLSQFSASNLDVNQFSSPTAPKGPYQMIFFCSPTGTDFTDGGANGAAGMTAIQNFITAGGAYGGLHSASDFENSEKWQFYYNSLMGSWFKDHNNDGTPGTVNTVTTYASHPVMRGIPNPWNTQDEWYYQNREMSSVAGFQILATLSGVPAVTGEPANDVRPVVWIKQFPVASDPTQTFEGRSFYTIRGHSINRYSEAPFRQLIHQGILWAAHRLN